MVVGPIVFFCFPSPIRLETKNSLKRTFVCSFVVDGQSCQLDF